MIYLTEAKVVFLKPRKVAGTSLEIALSQFATAADIITPFSPADEETRQRLGFRGPQNYRKPWMHYRWADIVKSLRNRKPAKTFYNHISAADVRRLLGADVFDNATKISIVRNPYDRLISRYFWDTARKGGERPPFREWALRNEKRFNRNDPLYFIDGTYVIDHTLKYETLLEDCRALEVEIPKLAGLADTLAKIHAKGSFRPRDRDTASYFADCEDLLPVVTRANQAIIDRFGYTLT